MKLYGLIGYPLEHSFSKKYFLEKFKKEQIDNVDYQNFPIENINELLFVVNMNPELSGLNITSPYKQQIIDYLYSVDEEAKEIGAVNAVKIIRENNSIELVGYNTDVYGFTKSLSEYLTPEIKSALIFGTGGAGKAVAYSLERLGIDYQFISSRPDQDGYLTYNSLNVDFIKKHKLLINATPLGMFPDIESKPDIPYSGITKSHLLFDLIYNPPVSSFLSEGKNRGANIINGLRMLELQAEKAWEIFNS